MACGGCALSRLYEGNDRMQRMGDMTIITVCALCLLAGSNVVDENPLVAAQFHQSPAGPESTDLPATGASPPLSSLFL